MTVTIVVSICTFALGWVAGSQHVWRWLSSPHAGGGVDKLPLWARQLISNQRRAITAQSNALAAYADEVERTHETANRKRLARVMRSVSARIEAESFDHDTPADEPTEKMTLYPSRRRVHVPRRSRR